VGVTVYNEGTNHAFGGIFARMSHSTALDAPAQHSTTDRTVDAYQRAWNKSESRVQSQLDTIPEAWEEPEPR
jgi:hypothetical protein